MSILQTVGLILLVLFLYAAVLVGCEKKIIYHPLKYPEGTWKPGSFGIQVEDVFFQAEDGVRLHGWWVPSPGARAVLLWFHGNAGNLTHRLDNIHRLMPLKLNVFIFDYRGYGKSEGDPDEPGLYLDSQAAYDVVVREKSAAPERLFLFGRSLGGVCAVEVASNNPAAGLILESVFTSTEDMARNLFPLFPLGWAIKSKFDALSRIPEVTLPKLFLHGTRDEIVPFRLGKKLYEAAASPKEFYAIEGASHNDTYIAGGPAYYQAWDRFITATLENSAKKQ
ncbi:MAG: alpha/beta hydrolase [Nitrospinaceae bacterium]